MSMFSKLEKAVLILGIALFAGLGIGVGAITALPHAMPAAHADGFYSGLSSGQIDSVFGTTANSLLQRISGTWSEATVANVITTGLGNGSAGQSIVSSGGAGGDAWGTGFKIAQTNTSTSAGWSFNPGFNTTDALIVFSSVGGWECYGVYTSGTYTSLNWVSSGSNVIRTSQIANTGPDADIWTVSGVSGSNVTFNHTAGAATFSFLVFALGH